MIEIIFLCVFMESPVVEIIVLTSTLYKPRWFGKNP